MPTPVSTDAAAPAVLQRFPDRSKGGIIGLAALLVAPAQFLFFETIAAAAWQSPRYSHFYNFISDLGVTNGPIVYQGREVDSPLGWLMNLSFMLLGVIGAFGILTLSRSLPKTAHRTWVRIGGIAFGVGGLLVGLFPENSVVLLHAVGAFLNIGFGDILLILVGARGARYYGMSPWLSKLVVALGTLGVVASIGLVTIPALFNGAVERTSAYPYMFTFVILAIVALNRARTAPARLER
jgi:hypothetical membrane protein